MANQAIDDMEMILPTGRSHGRIPVAEIARTASNYRTYNNIHINNSNIGVVNTGHLAKIDAAITISKGTESEEFGARLKDLTDAIVNQAEIDAQLKQKLVEIVQAISDQALSKNPSKIVISTLFQELQKLVSDVAVIAAAVESFYGAWDRLQSFLGGL